MPTRSMQTARPLLLPLLFLLLLTTLGSGCDSSSTCGDATSPITFTYTGEAQTIVLPDGVSSIDVEAYGARGGDGWNSDVDAPLGFGGLGGLVQATLDVDRCERLVVFVGGAGGDAMGNDPGLGGFNGGGDGQGSKFGEAGAYSGGGGGGASDIRAGGSDLEDRILVAGGGGAGSGWCTAGTGNGGDGGGLVGETGETCSGIDPGTGGSQLAGGDIGGAFGTGGSLNLPVIEQEAPAGGGGGYFGGGASNGSGAGGGSSYTDPGAMAVTHTQGDRDGDGEVTLSWVVDE